jgi:hypothetical protein
MEAENLNEPKKPALNKPVVGRSFSQEEIRQQARDFCDKWLPKWEKYCDVCKGCNCINNDSCIHCGCQF